MRKVLTEEQKRYIKEHPKESAFAMARKFGCTEGAVYYWLRAYHGNSFLEMKKKDRERKVEFIRKEYPNTSASEIGNELGITRQAVCRIARRLGVRHTDETVRKLHDKSVSAAHTEEARKRRKESITKTLRVDKFRAMSGMKQKTKRRFKVVPSKCFCARNYLTSRYNYFYDKDIGILLLIFYDKETKRLPIEREKYYSDKYGIQFRNADE